MHWGLHYVPAMLAMYQRDLGHAIIDAGADIILGHHPHMLRAIEVYKGKAIFYSLGNFAFDLYREDRSVEQLEHVQELYGWKPDPLYSSFTFPRDSKMTILAKCHIVDKKIKKVSFLPAMINKHGQPEFLLLEDKRSEEVINYMRWLCDNQKLDTKLVCEGNEVVIPT